MNLRDLLDVAGQIRYGMPTSAKEVLAVSGALPGAPVDRSAEQDAAKRYAAGYLFTREHPDAAKVLIPAATYIHALFGDVDTQARAHEGMNRAMLDVDNARQAELSKARGTIRDILTAGRS